jgi:hypothetical protein
MHKPSLLSSTHFNLKIVTDKPGSYYRHPIGKSFQLVQFYSSFLLRIQHTIQEKQYQNDEINQSLAYLHSYNYIKE